MPTLTKLFTMQEVSQHNTKDNCWVVIDGKVCDLTLYVNYHPGGDDVILAVAGRDATKDFEDVGHSKTAREIMEAFCIGELDVDTTSPEITSKNQQKIKDLTKQYWAVPVAAVGISVAVGFLYSRKK